MVSGDEKLYKMCWIEKWIKDNSIVLNRNVDIIPVQSPCIWNCAVDVASLLSHCNIVTVSKMPEKIKNKSIKFQIVHTTNTFDTNNWCMIGRYCVVDKLTWPNWSSSTEKCSSKSLGSFSLIHNMELKYSESCNTKIYMTLFRSTLSCGGKWCCRAKFCARHKIAILTTFPQTCLQWQRLMWAKMLKPVAQYDV